MRPSGSTSTSSLTQAEQALEGVLEELEIVRAFPEEVTREVEAWLERPGIDDPALVDRRALPFVTIDGATSRPRSGALHREGR
jgi:exoribonuclease R